jgi:hypothetical protein
MRKVAIGVITLNLILLGLPSLAQAGLNAPINLDNPRVVPIFGQYNASQISTVAGWSGFLYSPRIVLSAAHSHYKFDSNGNRIPEEPPFITVGKPNSSAKSTDSRVKVIKTFIGDYKRSNLGGANDFAVLVLAEDLIQITPAKLMSPEIETELVNARAEVTFHGYGEYRDRCAPGQKNPCPKDFNNPDQRTSELPRVNKINLAPKSDFAWLQGQSLIDASKETLVSNHKACSGDSGGPITTTYKGELLYLGQGLNGNNVYACGAGNGLANAKHPEELGMFSPVYKHLDLIKQAEEFIKQQSVSEKSNNGKSSSSITCVKGKSTKKVAGPNAKCPKGFVKKK